MLVFSGNFKYVLNEWSHSCMAGHNHFISQIQRVFWKKLISKEKAKIMEKFILYRA